MSLFILNFTPTLGTPTGFKMLPYHPGQSDMPQGSGWGGGGGGGGGVAGRGEGRKRGA